MLIFYLSLIDEPSDKELFKEIYCSNKKIMYNAAYKILQNHALTEEALQESFISIAEKIKEFRDFPKDKISAYMTVVARNRAIDLQKNEIKERGGNDTVDYEAEEVSLSVSDDLSMNENYNAILAAINSLDNIYSDVLLLKYVYGYSEKEISISLKIELKTVETRLYRGRKLLAKELEEQYGKQNNT